MKRLKIVLTLYFSIGLIWGIIVYSKGIECHATDIELTSTVIVNVISWPITAPMGIVAWHCER